MAESVEQLLKTLTGAAGESAVEVYCKWAGMAGDFTLEQAVTLKLISAAKGGQVKENLLATIKAGGGVGESLEECLTKTGLVGWS